MSLEDNYRDNNLRISLHEEDLDFNKYIHDYFTTKTPDIASTLSWSDLAFSLERCGWIEIYQKKETPLQINKCKVTEKFKGYFMISDVEAAFKDFCSYYPASIRVNERIYTTMDLGIDEMVSVYKNKILKGNSALNHERCIMITELFIKENKGLAPYKLSNYFTRFEGIAAIYETKPVNVHKSSTTGRTSI